MRAVRLVGLPLTLLVFAVFATGAAGGSSAVPNLTGKWIGGGFAPGEVVQLVGDPDKGPNAQIYADYLTSSWFCDAGGARRSKPGDREQGLMSRAFGGNFHGATNKAGINVEYCHTGSKTGSPLDPPGWHFGGGEATISADGNTISYTFKDLAYPFGSGSGSFRRVVAETTATAIHIGTAKVSLAERLKRLAKELRPQVDRLVNQKHALEDELPDLRAKFERASEASAAIDAKIRPLAKEVEQTQSFVAQIEAAEHRSQKAAVAQARNSLVRTMAKLQAQILSATLAGNQAKADSLQDTFDRNRRQLANLEASLKGHEQEADDLLDNWLSRLRVLSDRLFGLQRQWAQAERERWLDSDAVDRTFTRAAAVDEELIAVGAKLSALDFDIKSVTVTADGTKVFEAQLSEPARKLAALDKDIEAMGKLLPQLETQRHAAINRYSDAQRETIAALNNVATTIMAVAKKKAAVDFGYNAYDVLRAASKGGLAGAVAETAKKVAEAIVLYVADKDKTGAKEWEEAFNGNLKDALSLDKGQSIVIQRLAKDALSKPLKDKVNQTVMTKLFAKLYGNVGLSIAGVGAPPASPGLADKFRLFVKSFSNKQAHLANLSKGITKPWSSVKNAKGVFGDLGGKFLEDVSKNLAKAYFDTAEQEAWYAYFAKDVVARSYFPLWQTAHTTYWEAYDYYNGLLDQKAELLQGYSEKTNTRTIRSEKFNSKAKVRVIVEVERSAGTSGTIPLDVEVGGKKAAHVSGYTYSVDLGSLKKSAGGIGLEIQAR